MQKIFNAAEKLFFYILIVCLISFVYFNMLPMNNTILMMGFILAVFYFVVNFYVGYKYELTLREALIVGIIGCSVGVFLGIFSVYAFIILNNESLALGLIMPYYSPTISVVRLALKDITIAYPFIIMLFNILLVVIGAISKKIVNKLRH